MTRRGRKGALKIGKGQFLARVGSKYMIVIPQEVREELEIEQGDMVLVTVKKAKIEIVPED